METSEIKKLQQQTFKALEQKRIKDAFALLSPKLKELQDGDLIDSHYNLEMSYKRILYYTTEGTNDPGRQGVFNHLLQSIYQLADSSIDKLLTKYSGEYAYENKRSLIQSGTKLKTLISGLKQQSEDIKLKSVVSHKEEITQNYINLEHQLFHAIWLGTETNGDLKSIEDIFDQNDIPLHSKSLFISALLLRLLQSWDLKTFLLLFDLSENQEPNIQMKAIACLLISLYKYDSRLFLYPEVTQRIKLLAGNPTSLNLFQTIIIQLIRTKETEKISKKLKDEIIPEVVKMQPNIIEKFDLDNLTSGNPEDKNPEWSDFFADAPELMNKLEEISKWQMEGADVFLSTFQFLKHFPFFNQLPNWFVPFYLEHPQVKTTIRESGNLFIQSDLIENIADSAFLCNSDKYSLILSMPHMPSFQRDMMGQMFKAEIEQMGEIQKDDFILDPTKKKLSISNQYIQDLYRFFKIHPLNRQFEDIFNWKMDFYKKEIFKLIFPDTNSIRQIGEFLFKKEYYHDALEVFNQLTTNQPDNIELIQKTAYCHQQLNDYKNALELFLKADILNPDNKWTLKKIAFCYRHIAKPSKALKYYLAASKIDPDNMQTQASIGSCYLELNNFEDALKYYFKVEYLDPSNTKVWRPIGWCSFVLGKFDQAEKYYQKILVLEQNKHDLINIGHIQLCKGERKEALHYYQKSLGSSTSSIDDFLQIFNQDKKYLIQHGVDENDIPILLDQIRYSLEQ